MHQKCKRYALSPRSPIDSKNHAIITIGFIRMAKSMKALLLLAVIVSFSAAETVHTSVKKSHV